jgi:hypothetical protein
VGAIKTTAPAHLEGLQRLAERQIRAQDLKEAAEHHKPQEAP